jgi:hypothetical protein
LATSKKFLRRTFMSELERTNRIIEMANKEAEAIKAGDRTVSMTYLGMAIREEIISMTWNEYQVLYDLRYKSTDVVDEVEVKNLPSVSIPIWHITDPVVTLRYKEGNALISSNRSTYETLLILSAFPPHTILVAEINDKKREGNKGDIMDFMDEIEFPGLNNI